VDKRYDARGIANLILDRTDQAGRAISNMALNKLIYFSHAWFLVSFRRPLVLQHFEAWQHGPLIQDVYHSFKKFRDRPITSRAERLDRVSAKYIKCEVELDRSELALLSRIIEDYSPIPAAKLRGMTHVLGGPWERVWNYEGASNPGMIIPDDLIAAYYGRRLLSIGDMDAYSESPQPTSLRSFRQ